MSAHAPLGSEDFADAEQLSLSLSHTDVSAIQIGRGRFHARLRRRTAGRWHLQQISFLAGAASCAGAAAADRYSFVVPQTVGAGCRLLGRDLTGAALGVYAPGGEHADVSTAGLSECVLTPPPDLPDGLAARAGGLPLPASGSELRPVPGLALGELRCLIGEVAALPAGRLLQPQIVRAVSDALERALLQAVAAAPAEPRRGRTPLPRAATLRRLTEILEAQEGETVYASELAVAAGVSYPTLQRIFEDWVGTPPARYLTLRRLYLARRRLASGACTSVTEAATACGFWELGRFARRYRAQFGELPSQTLRRSR